MRDIPYDPNYDTVITTNSYAYPSPAAVAQAALAAANVTAAITQQAAAAAVRAARDAARQGASEANIVAAARAAALAAYAVANNGSAVGYQQQEPGILATAVNNWGSWVDYIGGSASDAASVVAKEALSKAVPVGLGALLGGTGAIVIGGAVLLAILLLKR